LVHFLHLSARVSLRVSILLALTVLSACASSKNVQNAAKAVEQFHSQMNTEQFQTIYVAADDGFHKATNESDFVALLQAVHKKLGNVQTSQRTNFQVGVSTGQGTVVTLVYNTAFDQGSGTEQFLWHMSDNQPTLLGYHINSNALILK
jgi:N-acetyl-beta-hexosaminidase